MVQLLVQSSKGDGILGSQCGKRRLAKQRSIVRPNVGNMLESCRSNAIWLVTVECSKPCDTVSFVRLCMGVDAALTLSSEQALNAVI